MIVHAICAAAYLALSALILVHARVSRTGQLLAAAALMTAVWAGAVALHSEAPLTGAAGAFDLLRSVAWYLFVLHLFRRSTTAKSDLGQAFSMMAFVALLVTGVTLLVERPLVGGAVSLWSAGIAVRLGLAVCNILLIENLYRNVREEARWFINLPCVALGALFMYDIVLSADAVLFHRVSSVLFDGRAVATSMVAPLLAVAAARNRGWDIDIHVSRSAVFHSATLIGSGIFLLGLAAAGEAFRYIGADWGGVAEVSLIFAGVVTIAVLLTSRTARSHVRSLVVDHFFSHRYDYRREWLRCIETLAAPDAYTRLPARAIRAVADVVDSPGGVLYLSEAGRESEPVTLQWAGAWGLPAEALTIMADHPLIAALRGGEWIVDVAALGPAAADDAVLAGAWLAVPLAHAGRLLGCVTVIPPRAPFLLDREVFDLLRIVGREVASYIAERRATEVLMEAHQLRDYGKRFAFVAHDIKNVSTQLTLLLANAEHHIANPEFQTDMLTTVRASVQKITALLRRIEAPAGPAQAPVRGAATPLGRLAELVAAVRRGRQADIGLDPFDAAIVLALPPGTLDAVVVHVLNNAIEATAEAATAAAETDAEAPPEPGPVRIAVRREAHRAIIDITDHGPGMTAEFIRDKLFRPFGTSKSHGSGIGAFQARELLRDAGGDLIAISQPGEGTTMRLMLPLARTPRAAAARLAGGG
jgi:putative PEP-CTERM system histidine kinase